MLKEKGKTLSEALNSLTVEQRNCLIYCFDNHITKIIKLNPDYFVGINITDFTNLQIIECKGHWCYGKIKNR